MRAPRDFDRLRGRAELLSEQAPQVPRPDAEAAGDFAEARVAAISELDQP